MLGAVCTLLSRRSYQFVRRQMYVFRMHLETFRGNISIATLMPPPPLLLLLPL